MARITDDGHIEYEENCRETGSEARTSKEEPVTVPTDFATGLKKGHMVVMRYDDKRVGVPEEVFADEKKKQLVGFFGLTL